jgi:2,3,4,5-tetrahydropyridine-2-carboxylate N-succinyltransferase
MSDDQKLAAGLGIRTRSLRGDGSKVLDVRFPAPQRGDSSTISELADRYGGAVSGITEVDPAKVGEFSFDAAPTALETVRDLVFVAIELDSAPTSVEDVYLRLHLLSWRLVRPHGLNLDGQFGILNNVVWTDRGPADPDGFDELRGKLVAGGHMVSVKGVDKFPAMVDYVVPSGVRLADGARVRLGAHLAEGTTVMHAGACNFNAGTLGTAMVEGRITAGVVLGNDTDLGGGASIMGTLSGGGTHVVSLGERCLVGANAGIGISLGDECVVEAGLYVTGGTRVTMPDGSVVKASELSGRSGMLFRRNSVSGAVEVIPNSAKWEGLNEALHSSQ